MRPGSRFGQSSDTGLPTNCFCPEKLGGACYFDPVNAELSDSMPTLENESMRPRGRYGRAGGRNPAAPNASLIVPNWRRTIARVGQCRTFGPGPVTGEADVDAGIKSRT